MTDTVKGTVIVCPIQLYGRGDGYHVIDTVASTVIVRLIRSRIRLSCDQYDRGDGYRIVNTIVRTDRYGH